MFPDTNWNLNFLTLPLVHFADLGLYKSQNLPPNFSMSVSNWNLLKNEVGSPASYTEADWAEAAKNLNLQGLSGLVFSRWKSFLPSEIRADFRQAWLKNWNQNLLFQHELQWITQVAAENNLQITILKGATLLQSVYADPGQRFMSDIDLLVPPTQIQRLVELLQTRGYQILETKKWKANDFKVLLTRMEMQNELVIELHSKLFFEEPPHFQWQRTSPAPGRLPRLQPADQSFHLLGHLGYQHTFLRLNWLLDIDLYVRKNPDLDWMRVWQLAQEFRQINSTLIVLFVAQKFLDTPLPSLGLRKTWQLRLAQKLITSEWLWSPSEHRFRYLIVKHLLKDSLFQAIRYDYLWWKDS